MCASPSSAQSSATVYPSSLSFTVQQNSVASPQDQSILVNSPTAGAYIATISPGADWLVIRPTSNLTIPGLLTVGIQNFSTLAAGAYTGGVIITPQDGSGSVTVAVTLTVQNAQFSVTPSSLSFTSASTGPAPAAQTISITSAVFPVQFTVAAMTSSGTGWLSASPSGGSTPGTVAVAVIPSGTTPGVYLGQIIITPSVGSPVGVPVTLTVTSPVALSIAPTALSFTPSQDGSVAPQTISVSNIGSAAVGFSVFASTQSGGNWLSVDAVSGTTPATLNVSANPQGLAPGQYTGSIAIVPSDPTVSPLTVNATLTLAAGSGPLITAITNAASFLTGPVAPGEIVVIFGSGLGPSSLAPLSMSPSGLVDNQLAGTQVFFDNVAAPLVYSSAQQIAAIVPYEVGRATTRVRVQYQSAPSAPVSVPVAASNPGIFANTSSGQGAILNQDYTLNSPKNGAAPGSVVSVFATGGGFTNPPATDGTIASGAASTVLPASVQIDGLDATVFYAGAAPDLPAGALQVNVQVPAGVRRGTSVPVVLTIGGASSQPNVTLAVKP